jgi:signal transduction histidine kinase
MEPDSLSVLAHQLRTPLGRLRDIISILEEEELGALTLPQREALAQQHRASEDMQRLVEDVLHASRVRASGLSYAFQKVNLCDIMDALHTRFAPFAQHKEIRFVWNKPESCFLEVAADAMKLSQALGNIVDNAIKYTPKGGRVTMRVATDENHTLARIEIADTGIGFSQNEKIFDAFVRGPEAQKAYSAGSGLGLFIASDIVRAHKGTLEGVSEGAGHGSSFFLELPLAH